MKRRTKLMVAVGMIVAGGLAVAVTADATERNARPPRPAWVNADGTVNQGKRPERVEVVGPDGKTARDAQGRPVTVDLRGRAAPPAGGPPPASPEAMAERGDGSPEIREVAPRRP